MTRSSDSLAALRDQAAAGIEDLIDVLALGASIGVQRTRPDDIRRPFRVLRGFDVSGIADDSHRLAAAYRAVAEQLHRLPEQQVRLGWGWASDSGAQVLGTVVDHQRRAESDLHVLRTLSDATGAASAGIDQLLRTWYLTVARLSAPLVAGIPVTEVPQAIVTGLLPPSVVVDDIASRAHLYFTTARATVDGVEEILSQLDRATEGMDIDPYPDDPPPAPVHLVVPRPPTAQSPAAESPPAESPAAESPSIESRAAESPSIESRAAESPMTADPVFPPAPLTEPSSPPVTSEPDDVDVPFRLSEGAPRSGDHPAPAAPEPPARSIPEPPAAYASEPRPSRPLPEVEPVDPSTSTGDLALAGEQ
ncbi:hypothetical protein [Gordonia rhizosphera]|uniref:Uncharacterized protein n=1 Tax=Gordonia rhizosphera NBRC 16068 TaxID=1108045 RepID=K6WTH2_9ACTN|nr:hypothetical protein [Gordonia rhizosphera]GAB89829.1 hypothetical protein GORHZ_072_00050 [Gordonia rhizosphera NBRC 16068]